MIKEIKNKNMAVVKNEFVKSYIAKLETIYGKENNKAFTVLNMFCFGNIDPVNEKTKINACYTDGKGDGKIDAIIIGEKDIFALQCTVSGNFDKDKYDIFLSNVKDLFFSESPALLRTSMVPANIKQLHTEYCDMINNANPTIHALYCYNGKQNDTDIQAIKDINLKYEIDDFLPTIKTLDDINKSLKDKVTNKTYNDILYTFTPFNAQGKENRVNTLQ